MRMMRLLYVVVWSLLLVSPTASLRAASQHEEEEEEQERLHPIRRIYDNAHVRREVARLEERIERYQTGLPANPDHVVPYKNHPFDRSQQRQLQENATVTDDDGAGVEEGDDDTPATMPTSNQQSLFQPMRIKFFTEALDSIQDDSNAAKIEWYKREILPKTAEFWSSALAVVPVDGNLKIDAGELDSRLYCGDSAFTQVPDSHSSQGVSDADLILYVSGSNDSRFCPERTLAVAVPCNFDQFDRPTAGAINVCLDNIVLRDDGSASNGVTQDYVDVTIHEVGHVLGMSSNSYRFFWDPTTGKPRTERPFTARSVVCVNGAERSLILPAENTMVFVDDASGNRYASIVTEKVRTVARNQFDCQSLEGGRLENQPTREDSCTGDHWDERLFYPEALSGVISPTANVFSSLTLALMEDSGWYQANYTVTRMSPWGLGVGCSFVEDPCLVASSEGTTIPEYSQGYFCVSENEKSCSSEHTHKMACTIVDYAYYVPQDLPVEQYQYFPDAPSKGGPRQANFCPVFGSPYNSKTAEELDCRDPDNLSSFNVYSEYYGEDSRCIPSSLGEGLCLRTACVQDEMALRINVRGEWLTCEYDFQKLEITVGQGIVPATIVCPRLSQACPDLFCPFNCAGRGTCNYANTIDGVVRPKCECFDSSDTTPGCSESLVPDGGFLDDSSGLKNNVEQNFFDPLVAVFVDHPDKWTTASWAWAAGLLAIFLILLLCICSSMCSGRNKRT